MATDTYATTVKFGSTTLETGKQYVVTGTSPSQTVEEASTSETTGFIHWDSTTHTMELDNVSFTNSFLFSFNRQEQIVDKAFHFFIPVAERLHTAYGRLKPAAHSAPPLGYELLPFANLPL